ncbi:MAG: F0F1 ATP synthase subunit epsilon [Acetobacteraceae bacterium]|nr:F0F1 ATP synthase subunit epsilon [Acetobacteraceae bacterium]
MANTLKLEIVTPDRLLVSEQVEEVEIPGKSGYLEALPEHAPLITELAPGELSYTHGGAVTRLAVSWGFAEVLPDKVTVLAQAAERPEDIDVPRAQEARKRAEQALQNPKPELDYDETLAALRRAEVRLQVASEKGQK